MGIAVKSTAPKAFPKDFQRLQVLWSEIRRRLFDDGAHPDSTAWEDGLSTGSWAWTADFRRVAPWDIDRTRDVLLGPLFSSLAHPWPEDDGSPMIPLAQFDLENASKVGGVDLGSGLLQLFCRQSDRLGKNITVRVLERSEIDAEALTAIPDFSNASALFASVAWASCAEDPDERMEEELCTQISAYPKQRFTLNKPPPMAEVFSTGDVPAELRPLVHEFDAIVAKNAKTWNPGGFHLFGTFCPIQYSAAERPAVLFTLESEYGFNFGDGQAQVFYACPPQSSVHFSFDWSCY